MTYSVYASSEKSTNFLTTMIGICIHLEARYKQPQAATWAMPFPITRSPRSPVLQKVLTPCLLLSAVSRCLQKSSITMRWSLSLYFISNFLNCVSSFRDHLSIIFIQLHIKLTNPHRLTRAKRRYVSGVSAHASLWLAWACTPQEAGNIPCFIKIKVSIIWFKPVKDTP